MTGLVGHDCTLKGALVSALLAIDHISRSFGGVYASRDVSLEIPPGELRGIIGPNGAGKSTLFNLISGHLRPDVGRIALSGADITQTPPHVRANRGVQIVFQGARTFPGMTVLENVMVGAHARTSATVFDALVRSPRHRREERMIRERAWRELERVGLVEWADRSAEGLPIGQQRHLQIARALAGSPELLLLDEPASGLRAGEREQFSQLIEQLKGEGMTIMLIEHDVSMVTRLADRITVLNLGEVIAEGTPEEIRTDRAVIEAYLGGELDHAAGA